MSWKESSECWGCLYTCKTFVLGYYNSSYYYYKLRFLSSIRIYNCYHCYVTFSLRFQPSNLLASQITVVGMLCVYFSSTKTKTTGRVRAKSPHTRIKYRSETQRLPICVRDVDRQNWEMSLQGSVLLRQKVGVHWPDIKNCTFV